MDVPESQRETARMLQDLAGGAAPVETHASLVFVGADTVWKLKKAVRLPFLDFTAVQDRRRFAERELGLNAPAAKGLYRDVVPVVRRPDGTLALDTAVGEPVDWVVRMARVPEADFLDAMARDGRIGPAELDAVADVVAAYHAALPPARDTLPPMHRIAHGNHRSAIETGLDDAIVSHWRGGMLGALDGLDGWMRQRAGQGFVRRAHGDLHLGNMCLWHGRPVPFDALEFDEVMATIDLGYDLAFLLMDLDRRSGRAAANRTLNRYLARTGDVGMLAGMPAFLSMRAMVRAHVEARTGRVDVGAGYLGAACRYLKPCAPVIIAIGGLQGTGKSTLARAIAPTLGVAPGAVILRSDEIRKRRYGVAPERRLPPEAYEASVSEAVFRDLIMDAGRAASAGHAVVADATFLDPAHRKALADTAADAGVSLRGFWLDAPFDVLARRISEREGDASDATVAVLRAAAMHNPGPGEWEQLDATDVTAASVRLRQLLAAFLQKVPLRPASGEDGP